MHSVFKVASKKIIRINPRYTTQNATFFSVVAIQGKDALPYSGHSSTLTTRCALLCFFSPKKPTRSLDVTLLEEPQDEAKRIGALLGSRSSSFAL